MSQRRMFSQRIVGSDAFLEMPTTSRELYFQLGMYADDDGFVSPKKIMRMIGASDDDLKMLLAKKFILAFENGVIVIKHWKMNNQIRQDRYTETQYLEQKSLLFIKDNGSYSLNSESGLPNGNQMATQYSIGKDSIGKISIEKNTYGEFGNVLLKKEEYDKLCSSFGENNTKVLIEELSTYMASKRKSYASHYATLLNWGRKKVQDYKNNKKRTII